MTKVTLSFWEKGNRFYINTEDGQSIAWFAVQQYRYNSKSDSMEEVEGFKVGGNGAVVAQVIAQIRDRAEKAEINLSGDSLPNFFCKQWKKVCMFTKKQAAEYENLDRTFNVNI